jgi:hypothetical protein
MGRASACSPIFQVEEDVQAGRLVRLLPDARIEPVPFT